jgi:hypothetical protein
MASSAPPTVTLNHATQNTAKNVSRWIWFGRMSISQGVCFSFIATPRGSKRFLCAWLHAVRLLWLLAKLAEIAGRAFAYTPAARKTMWSLTLPQVAATLAATLVAFDTRNPAGQRLIDSRLLNVVLVLMLNTSILGPVLTEHFAPRMLEDVAPPDGTAGTAVIR